MWGVCSQPDGLFFDDIGCGISCLDSVGGGEVAQKVHRKFRKNRKRRRERAGRGKREERGERKGGEGKLNRKV